MEYIKTQLQLQSLVKPGGQKPAFNGMIGGLVYTVRTHGFFALYRGLGVTLVRFLFSLRLYSIFIAIVLFLQIGSVPKAGIRFGGNAYFKQILADKQTGKLTMGHQFLAGMGAGTVEAILAVTPMETIKTKLIQTNQPLVPGVKSILRESGIRGIYQGLIATILKQGSNQGLRFMFFNKYKEMLADYSKKKNGKAIPLNPLQALLGGMMAGCFSTLGNNPFDVVKTQMQGKDAAKKYKNTLDCFVKIWQEEGLRGYYKGVVPRLGRVVPGQGVIFMSFETVQEVVERNFFTKKV
jgi:solute carrier family 25 citrate transporter 1